MPAGRPDSCCWWFVVGFRSGLGSLDERLRPGSGPWAYFLTFACYGARLHGSDSGSVDREHNVPGTSTLRVHERRVRFERREMTNPPTTLSGRAREIALLAIRDVCDFRGWVLHAAHVRSNPVHIVVAASAETSELLQKFKTRISRALNAEFGQRRWWARHGSTVPLWDPRRVDDAVAYTWDQGEPMARYLNPDRWFE
jgi:REP element-mobilizing transposase RayT